MTDDQTPTRPAAPTRHKGTFAEGESDPKAYPDELKVGTFAEGEERLPDSPEKEHRGTFAEGESDPERYPDERHVGRFGETEKPSR